MVLGYLHGGRRYGNDLRPLQLPDDEVDEDGKEDDDVDCGDEDKCDGHLEAAVISLTVSSAVLPSLLLLSLRRSPALPLLNCVGPFAVLSSALLFLSSFALSSR